MLTAKTLARFTLLSGLLISTATFSYPAPPAAYAGLQLGWGKVHQDGISSKDVQDPPLRVTGFSNGSTNTGFAGRLFAGFQLNSALAAEFGWTRFRDVSTTATINYSNGATIIANGSERTDAIDLVVKGSYYFEEVLSIYAKLGGAYLIQREAARGSAGGASFVENNNLNRLFPTFGLGIAYDIMCNLSTDLAWMHIQKINNSQASSTDFGAIGLIYKFM